VGGGARKTNKDYTAGTLPELVDIIIEEKARLRSIRMDEKLPRTELRRYFVLVKC
jgi:hypothetical protein